MEDQEIKEKMEKSLEVLKKNLSGVRTGRANPGLVENIVVDVYGQKMPLKHVASINISEGRSILINPFDKSNTQLIEKAISMADLGLTPMDDGHQIRITLPELNEERRKELDKIIRTYAEESRVSVRNIRREAIDDAKKSGDYSDDDLKGYTEEVQKSTDDYTKKIDELLKHKEAEIMEI